jgi:hypothetical protein
VSGNTIDVEMVRTLTRLQGLEVPDEDLEPLAAALTRQFEAGARILDRYGDADVEPPLVFDPRWK